jgi:hypothetical protein
LNSKKTFQSCLALVRLPKKEGGLGVIDVTAPNNALLKFLHKFYMKMDLP